VAVRGEDGLYLIALVILNLAIWIAIIVLAFMILGMILGGIGGG